MSERFFVDTPIQGPSVCLKGPEAHHLARVMRARAGDRVVLFDGSGSEFVAQVERRERSLVKLVVLERLDVDRELPFRLTLGLALPRGDRQRWLVEKLVELGVTALVPLQTERGVAQPSPSARSRLQRTVIEASKQCGRNRLLRIDDPVRLADYVKRDADGSVRLMAHPGKAGSPLGVQQLQHAPAICVVVGPEGGFSEAEVAVAREGGWTMIDLGTRVLRVETAAVAMASLVVLQRTTTTIEGDSQT